MTPGQRHVVFSGDNLLLAAVNAQIFSGMTSARAECDVTPGISGGGGHLFYGILGSLRSDPCVTSRTRLILGLGPVTTHVSVRKVLETCTSRSGLLHLSFGPIRLHFGLLYL
jgi:hypothetical protein